jgi:hypothetical protein
MRILALSPTASERTNSFTSFSPGLLRTPPFAKKMRIFDELSGVSEFEELRVAARSKRAL